MMGPRAGDPLRRPGLDSRVSRAQRMPIPFIRRAIGPEASRLITDEYGPYNVVRRIMKHAVIQHAKRYSDGDKHSHQHA